MEIANWIILIAAFCLIPAGVLWLCRRFSLLGKIGPVLILYFIGIIIGNIGLMPGQLPAVQELMSNAMVPLAIPLMLFGCTFKLSGARSQLLALITGMISVATAVVIGFLIFGDNIPEGNKVGGMLVGVYTGGTINLAALKTMLGVSDETYIMINSYDILVSFLYLTFLLTIGIKLFRKFLTNERKSYSEEDEAAIRAEIGKENQNPYKGLFTRPGMAQAGKLLGLTALIVGVSAGIALLLPSGMFMTVFILLLTTLGIACSFIKPVREMKYSYDMGMYFIYIFCIAVASMADLSKLDFAGGIGLLGYLLAVVFGSLILQVIFAKIFRIDSDMMVISSVTYINSPPFVPMMAAAMKNKDVLIPGLTIGVIGYAAGNYMGFLMSQLLGLL
ncbi:MAG: DUF819 family protein [Bacteroidales bacterium]|nr:DUF819 family protein [Bacteroidales bacterium]